MLDRLWKRPGLSRRMLLARLCCSTGSATLPALRQRRSRRCRASPMGCAARLSRVAGGENPAGACAYRVGRWTGGTACCSNWSRSAAGAARTARSACSSGQANKELIRNLAREIKNPLGGIRGAAQLLEMEDREPRADHTRRSSSTRPTACRRWSTGCWRRTASRTWWATSTSTRSASMCAADLASSRAAWWSARLRRLHPEFRGDREQLIQAVLNIVHNAAQALPSASPPATRRSRCARASRASGDAGQARVIVWHWNCISRTTARACPSPSASASSTRWCRAGWWFGTGAHAARRPSCSNTGHDRMRERTGPDAVQDPDSDLH